MTFKTVLIIKTFCTHTTTVSTSIFFERTIVARSQFPKTENMFEVGIKYSWPSDVFSMSMTTHSGFDMFVSGMGNRSGWCLLVLLTTGTV